MKYLVLYLNIFSFLVFTGCGKVFTGYGGDLGRYDGIYMQNSCEDKFVEEQTKSNDDAILWTELAGSFKRQCQDYNASNFYFDMTEDRYKNEVDLENFGKAAIKNVGATLTNDNSLQYQGNIYEAIMVNTYKGLNFMSLNDFKNARIEFNRALDRQRRAKNKFAKNIKKRQEELKKSNKNTQVHNNKSEDFIASKYTEGLFKDFQAYPDFINPFTTYMSALFYISDKDYRKARDLLKESVAMNPKNQTIKDDFKMINKKLAKRDKNNYIWLIYENGKSMTKDEFRLDLPVFLVSKKVLYTGIALPTLKEQAPSYSFLSLNDQKTKLIADMDRVVKTEFKIKLPFIVTKSVIRTIAKTVAQAQVSDRNAYAGLALAVFNGLTNKADVRSWVSLPKNFQATRVVSTGKEVLIKDDMGNVISSVMVPKSKNAIIYVNSPAQQHSIMHKILF